MTDQIFKQAERLRNNIAYYKKSINDAKRLLQCEFTTIRFCNCDTSYNDVNFNEDKGFVKTSIKSAIVNFEEKLSIAESELEKL